MSQFLTSKLLTWLTVLLSVLLAGAGLFFLILTVQRSRLPYNSEGNYFDGVVNYHEQSIVVYGVMAAASFLTAVTLLGIHKLIQRNVQRVRKDGPDPNLESVVPNQRIEGRNLV
jgi:hypothetical protein